MSVLKACAGMEAEIFVVDNNSSDGTVPYISARFPSVKIIANKDNPGFSKANNQALCLACGDFILVLNPDTVVAENTFRRCIDFMEARPGAGALGVKMVDGKGVFLPESKRALPSPGVAFYRMFGLASLFPRSRRFGKYHLSYLPPDETNPVDILSGAFMFFRKKVLDEIGYFDEAFFMYGEDIDLSYRVLKAGYNNYYFAGTCIIHYKGESTKKGSLNYVRVFYQAMIIFARKHFAGSRAGLFSFLINLAVVFRAVVTVLINILSSSYLVLIDGLISFAGIYYLILLYARNVKNAPAYYPVEFIGLVAPAYLFIWLLSVYFSGAYEKPYRVAALLRGIVAGTVAIAALYAFLPESMRFSRAIILLGAACTAAVMLLTRLLYGLLRYQDFGFERRENHRVLIAGSAATMPRARRLLQALAPLSEVVAETDCSQNTDKIAALAALFKAREIVFCAETITFTEIIRLMQLLGPVYHYKILNPGTDTLMGSNSKNSSGDLYAGDLNFSLGKPISRHQKRLLDIGICICMLAASPLLLLAGRVRFLRHWWKVFTGAGSWIGYRLQNENSARGLPLLKPGVFYPGNGPDLHLLAAEDIWKLNYLYAKHYNIRDDISILLDRFRQG